MKPLLFAFSMLFLFAASLPAQSTQPLTLEDCLGQALQQNPEIQTAEIGLLLPDQQRAEVRAGLRPQITAAGSYQYYLEVPRQMVPASAFGGPEGQYTAAQFGVPLNLSTSLQATQVLYSQPLLLALKQMEIGREVAQLQLRSTREDVAYNVSAAFFNAQAMAKQITFLEGNLASLEKVTQTTRLLAEQQLATPVDVQRLQLQQENLQNQLQNLRDQHQRTLRLLQLLMGVPQTETIRLDTAIRIPAAAGVVQPELQRTDLQLVEKQKTGNLLEQQRIRAGALPTIAAFGTYSYSGFGKFGDNNLLKFYPSSALGLSLQWNIFDGQARRARLSQKSLEFQQLDPVEPALARRRRIQRTTGR